VRSVRLWVSGAASQALTGRTSAASSASAGSPAAARARSDQFAEQRSSVCSTMIIVPPGPANTDHVIPATSACARVQRDMSCLVVMCAMSVTPVITASLL